MKKLILIAILSSFINLAYAQHLKLIYAVDVIRHGARAPIQLMPNAAAQYHWQSNPGQLLPIGFHEVYLLGVNARHYYINRKHFLPADYSSSLLTQITLYSTDMNRTLQSAQAFSQGFYPLGTGPKNYKQKKVKPPLPQAMTVLPIRFDKTANLLSSSTPKKRLEYKKLIQHLITNLPKNNACISLYDTAKKSGSVSRWARASGFKLTGSLLADFNSLNYLGDNVLVRKAFGIPLPHNTQMSFDVSDETKIAQLADACYSTLYRFKIVAKMTSGKMLNTIIQNMKNVAAGKTKLHYNLYSSHDSYVASLMTLLGVPLYKHPNFASDVRLELYQVNNENNYIVRLSYNNVLQTFPKSICGKATKSCDFYYFQRIVKVVQ